MKVKAFVEEKGTKRSPEFQAAAENELALLVDKRMRDLLYLLTSGQNTAMVARITAELTKEQHGLKPYVEKYVGLVVENVVRLVFDNPTDKSVKKTARNVLEDLASIGLGEIVINVSHEIINPYIGTLLSIPGQEGTDRLGQFSDILKEIGLR